MEPLKAMTTKKKLKITLIVLVLAVVALPAYWISAWFAIYPIEYFRVGRPSYSKARGAADLFMGKSSDGPWLYTRSSFILEFDGTKNGRPTWVFRYHNSNSGEDSRRIYVPIPEYQVHLKRGLDPLPLHGSLPR